MSKCEDPERFFFPLSLAHDSCVTPLRAQSETFAEGSIAKNIFCSFSLCLAHEYATA